MEPRNIIMGIILCIVIIGGRIYVNGFKNWLVWAVTEAESMFGSNTGKLKLRYAYTLAIERYPTIAKFIPFSLFSKLVDKALDIMREMIANNKTISDVVSGKINEIESQ